MIRQENGYITVFPHDPRPTASNLNFVAGQPRPNSVIGPVGSDGELRMFKGSERPVDLIADVSGYFISNPVRCPGQPPPPVPRSAQQVDRPVDQAGR